MKNNDVLDCLDLPDKSMLIARSCFSKAKWDSRGNVERSKARLIAKAFTQCE